MKGMLLDIARPNPADLLPPEVNAARCVHSRMEQATCRACVDACPTQAWVIDDAHLGIDTDRCDGCGLCATACPEGAILERFTVRRYRVEGTGVAFAACAAAGVDGTDAAVLPCLHVLGPDALLRLHGQGVRRLVLCRGACDDCVRGGVTRVHRHWEAVSALLRDRAEAPIVCENLTRTDWTARLVRAKADHAQPGLNRRNFLHGWLRAATETAVDLASRDPDGWPDFVPPGRLIPRTDMGLSADASSQGLSLHAPAIDARRCTGCDACARICAHGVIRVEPDAYRLNPDGCTGCGMCKDVCAAGAISLRQLDPCRQTRLPLRQGRCAACGVAYHVPFEQPSAHGTRCPICTASHHQRQLFQVLG